MCLIEKLISFDLNTGLGSFYSKEDGFTNIINANLTNCNDKQKHSGMSNEYFIYKVV